MPQYDHLMRKHPFCHRARHRLQPAAVHGEHIGEPALQLCLESPELLVSSRVGPEALLDTEKVLLRPGVQGIEPLPAGLVRGSLRLPEPESITDPSREEGKKSK